MIWPYYDLTQIASFSTNWEKINLGTVRYSDVSFLRTVFIPNGFYSERSFLWTVLNLWSERLIKFIAPKILIPKCHCSEWFLIRKVFIPNGFYPERFWIRTVLIRKGRFSEIRNKNLSDQKPFGSKNFVILKNSTKLYVTRRGQIWHVWDGETVLNWWGSDIEFHWYYEDDDTCV